MAVFSLFLLLAAVAYLVGGAFLFFQQRKLQYGPTHKDAAARGNKFFKAWRPAQEFLGYARLVPHARQVVLFFHGSRGEALDRSWVGELVSEDDSLILVEYPGFGARSGKISEAAILADADRVFIAAQELACGARLVVVGEGLGAAVASYLASKHKVDRLALISPFSPDEVASKRYRIYPVKWLMKDRYPTLKFLQSATAPLHIVHGTLDESAPLEQGRAIFQSYPGVQKRLEEVPGFGHSNLDHALLHSPFTSQFRRFLTE